jgi:hypothetical protein
MDIGKLTNDHGLCATRTRWVNQHPEEFHNGTYKETCQPIAECYYYDDFWNKLDFWVAADNSAGFWAKQLTGAAPPRVEWIAGAGGLMQCILTVDGQAQTAGLDCGDVLTWNPAFGLQFECKLIPVVLPTLLSEAWWGVAGANVETSLTAGGPLVHAFFALDGDAAATNASLFIHTDDGATSSGWVDTGVDLVAGTGACFRIDFTDPTSTKFYVNGVRVCKTTTFVMTAATLMQPMIQLYKANPSAGLGNVVVDYVRLWQERY